MNGTKNITIETASLSDMPKQEDFLLNPRVQENYNLLQDMGIFRYIESLNREIKDYKDLFSSVLSIFHHNALENILDTVVVQINHRINLSSVIFLWKSFQNKDEITIKGYKDQRIVDTGLLLESIAPFESFFQEHPKSISYHDLIVQMSYIAPVRELEKVKPELIVPILGHSGLYGLILIGGKIHGERFSSTELIFIQQFMSFVSLAIQNHLNYDHSMRDVKTGLYNYGFFMTRMTEELARMKRNEYASSIIVIDVDFFKRFNDTYGHVAGDKVLESIAAMIKHGVRLEDVPARFGGEEFTILLPDTSSEAAWCVAERLRKSIAALVVPWEKSLSQVTISLGIFTFSNMSDILVTEIIDRADKALYKSKERGRNCTTIWEPNL
jgi:diguanylate cyclase (GGDEF)-like protein